MVETILKSSEAHPNVDPGLVVASTACPFGKLLEVLGKSHTLEILYILGISSPQRFTRIQNDLELQPKALTARLQELVKFGLLTRKSYDEIPPRVDYEVSQKGRALGKMFDEIHAWYNKYGDLGSTGRKTGDGDRISSPLAFK